MKIDMSNVDRNDKCCGFTGECFSCPNCSYDEIYNEHNYCPKCGGKLYWNGIPTIRINVEKTAPIHVDIHITSNQEGRKVGVRIDADFLCPQCKNRDVLARYVDFCDGASSDWCSDKFCRSCDVKIQFIGKFSLHKYWSPSNETQSSH